MPKNAILVSFLIFSVFFVPIADSTAQSESEYVIPLQGPTWDHSVISVLIIPSWSETWWQAGYLDAATRSISQWNDAMTHFSSNKADYSYISRLKMEMKVSNSSETGFDVYISWIDRFRNETCEAGLTRTVYSTNVIINSTLTLAAHDCYGNVMSERDVQNVALHELGHSLGLGHPNVPEDLMYFAYSLSSPTRAISTLDAFGVANVFRWMENSSDFNPDSQGQPVYSVALPSDIEYEYLPISDGSVTPQTTIEDLRTFIDDLVQFILRPEALILFIIVVSVVTVYVITISLRGKRTVSREPSTSYRNQT